MSLLATKHMEDVLEKQILIISGSDAEHAARMILAAKNLYPESDIRILGAAENGKPILIDPEKLYEHSKQIYLGRFSKIWLKTVREFSPQIVFLLVPNEQGKGFFTFEFFCIRIGKSKVYVNNIHDITTTLTPFSLLMRILSRNVLNRILLLLELIFAFIYPLFLYMMLPFLFFLKVFSGILRKHTKKTSILFLPFYPSLLAGARYRVYKWMELLRMQGYRCSVSEPISNENYRRFFLKYTPSGRFISYCIIFVNRFLTLFKIPFHDIIFLRMGYFPYFPFGSSHFEKIITKIRKNIVFDLDDAIYLYYRPPKTSNPLLAPVYKILDHPERVAEIMVMSERIILGNYMLRDYAAKHVPASKIYMIPTCIDTDRYRIKEHKATASNNRENLHEPSSHRPVIGWVGTPWNLRHLKMIAPALKTLADEHNFHFMVISSMSFSIQGVSVICRQWSLEREIEDLLEFDIGIMPLEPGEEPESKCGFKALQYMGVGIPVVASPVGVNREIINDSENGFLAGHNQEWVSKLGKLIKEPELRSLIGLNGRRTVEQKYSFQANLPLMLRALSFTR